MQWLVVFLYTSCRQEYCFRLAILMFDIVITTKIFFCNLFFQVNFWNLVNLDFRAVCRSVSKFYCKQTMFQQHKLNITIPRTHSHSRLIKSILFCLVLCSDVWSCGFCRGSNDVSNTLRSFFSFHRKKEMAQPSKGQKKEKTNLFSDCQGQCDVPLNTRMVLHS